MRWADFPISGKEEDIIKFEKGGVFPFQIGEFSKEGSSIMPTPRSRERSHFISKGLSLNKRVNPFCLAGANGKGEGIRDSIPYTTLKRKNPLPFKSLFEPSSNNGLKFPLSLFYFP